MTDRHGRLALYEERYAAAVGFERTMVEARKRCALEILERERPARVVEIGCGTDPLYAGALHLAPALERWTIVEPVPQFAQIARKAAADDVRLEVLEGFFEERHSEIRAGSDVRPDFVVCLGVLQSIEDPVSWLGLSRELLTPDGKLLLVVANSLSFHRRLARHMGLIADERELSGRDRELFHHHVFDMEELKGVVGRAGFSIEQEGGYLVKPFTHSQMERLTAVIGPRVLDGLSAMGRALPELAAEIYVVATPAGSGGA